MTRARVLPRVPVHGGLLVQLLLYCQRVRGRNTDGVKLPDWGCLRVHDSLDVFHPDRAIIPFLNINLLCLVSNSENILPWVLDVVELELAIVVCHCLMGHVTLREGYPYIVQSILQRLHSTGERHGRPRREHYAAEATKAGIYKPEHEGAELFVPPNLNIVQIGFDLVANKLAFCGIDLSCGAFERCLVPDLQR